MDLGSMLNSGDAPPELSKEASAAYRRLSETSPAPHHKALPSRPEFLTPDAASSRSDEISPSATSAKRKLGESEDERQDKKAANGNGIKREASYEGTPARTAQPLPAKPKAYEGSYAGITPLTDIAAKVKQFILFFLTEDSRTAGKSGLEIEAKLGLLIDKETQQRIDQNFPLITAAVLHPAYDCAFRSDMTTTQHKAYNQHLNTAVQESNQNKSRRPIIYKHTYLTDTIYSSSHGTPRVRVTTDDKTGAVVEIIAKEKIDNLHILSPNTPFDLRISINLEHPAELPTNQEPQTTRRKDRLTYSHQNYQIDLTQVKSPNNPTTHELEVEMTGMEELMKQARYEVQGLENKLDELVIAFVGTITQLTRVASDFAE